MTQHKRNLRSSFEEAALEYDEARPSYPQELVEDIVRISGIQKGGRILEVGCGTGQATIPFALLGFSMLCLDIGKKLTEIAREKCKNFPNVEILCTSFEEWKPRNETFDLLISGTAFHWIAPEVGYSKAVKVLKKTGYMALFWNMPSAPYTGFFEDVQKVYREVVPEWGEPGDSKETERKILERADNINETGLFEKVQVKRYSWSKVYRTNQYMKLLNTYSDHRTLEEYKRAQLYRGIRNLIENEYGGGITRPYLSVLYLARKS